MNHIKRMLKFRDVRRRTRVVITEQQLENWRRIDDPPVSFAKSTSSRSDRLLSDMELIPCRAEKSQLRGLIISPTNHITCLERYVGAEQEP